MDCERFQELIQPCLDGSLAEECASAIERHAIVCLECGARLQALQSAIGLLRQALPEETISPGFRERLLARLQEQFGTKEPVMPSPAQRPLPF